MPKMKTHRATAKRFRVTKNGKVMCGKAYSSHILTKKSPKRKRNFRKDGQLSGGDASNVKTRLGA